MSYTEIENEHHDEISRAIVDLRNAVEKLWLSARNQRGQALACGDPQRSCALYESGAAYADAAQRMMAISRQFDELESFRAGAMEAIGPVRTYDALEADLAQAKRDAETYRERWESTRALLESRVEQPAIPKSLFEQAQRATGQATQAQWEPMLGNLVAGHDVTDVDGELTVGRVVHVEVDFVNVEVPKYHSVNGWYRSFATLDRTELRLSNAQESEIFWRHMKWLTHTEAASQLRDTTPYQGMLENGSSFVGLYVGTTDAGKVKLQRPIKHAEFGWGVRLEEVEHATVRAVDGATAQEFHKLVDQSEAEIHGELPVTAWTQGQVVIATQDSGATVTARFVAVDSQDDDRAVIEFPAQLQTADGVDTVWETRTVAADSLAAASPGQLNEFFTKVTEGGLS